MLFSLSFLSLRLFLSPSRRCLKEEEKEGRERVRALSAAIVSLPLFVLGVLKDCFRILF